ncbi:ketopantoate reductase family protein [uncultured Schumannella sp.]|uniref:ketopantoate reductase family protein n=1 Tax=uncultured Schumannella sp. TaxID=1195956 RepID=UPI0025F8DDF3|nr:2-dehydropantoate 2-reductase [uncultured Schumannella sp.]
MRIGIIGAGAVGGALAALLDRAGHEVAVAARGAHLAAIRENGIRLDGGFGDHVAHVSADEFLTEAPELAILATKAQDARAALDAHSAVLRGVPLLVVQNGLGGLDVAREELPDATLFGGLALFAASYLSPGKITITAALPLVIGAAEGTSPEELERLAATLSEALPTEVAPDLDAAQWSKLLVNHVNALPAITGLSVQEVVADPGLRRVMTASMRETVRVARRLGIRLGDMQGVSGRVLETIGWLPLAVGSIFPRMLADRMGDVPNPGSTLQSIQRGQLTEIDFLNGAVVGLAQQTGIGTPTNAALVTLVHQVERSGQFLEPETVLARVPV